MILKVGLYSNSYLIQCENYIRIGCMIYVTNTYLIPLKKTDHGYQIYSHYIVT